jgi:hypothetical protein
VEVGVGVGVGVAAPGARNENSGISIDNQDNSPGQIEVWNEYDRKCCVKGPIIDVSVERCFVLDPLRKRLSLPNQTASNLLTLLLRTYA